MKNYGKEDWLSSYKAQSTHWTKSKKPSRLVKKFYHLLKTQALLDKKVLEVGIGNGRDSLYLAGLGCNVIGIDLSSVAVKLAKKSIVGTKLSGKLIFKTVDVEEMVFRDNSFGAVFSVAVLHSCNVNKAFKEIYRVLAPGGLAFLHLWQATIYVNKNKKIISCRPGQLIKVIKKIGFELVESKTDIKTGKIDREDNSKNDHYHTALILILKKPISN